MQNEELKSLLKGIFSIVVTPFNRDGAFDFNAREENIERVISLGYDGLLIGGTYGEARQHVSAGDDDHCLKRPAAGLIAHAA